MAVTSENVVSGHGMSGGPASSLDERFDAAVKVIRSLPKDGSYQPSNELMLKFYSCFKQATEGPCNIARPSMFNVVARAKYEAWKAMGNRSRDDAKRDYVEHLKDIVETMSMTEDVSSFLDVLGPFFEEVDGQETIGDTNGVGLNGCFDAMNGSNGIPEVVERLEDTIVNSRTFSENDIKIPNGSTAFVPFAVVEKDVKGKDQSPDDDENNDVDSDDDEIFAETSDHVLHDTSTTYSSGLTNDGCENFLDDDEDQEDCKVVVTKAEVHFSRSLDQSNPLLNTVSKEISNGNAKTVLSYSNPAVAVDSDGIQQMRGGAERPTQRQGQQTVSSGGLQEGSGSIPSSSQQTLQPINPQQMLQAAGSSGNGPPNQPHFAYATEHANDHIALTLFRLQQDMERVVSRLSILESMTIAANHPHAPASMLHACPYPGCPSNELRRYGTPEPWWHFQGLSAKSILFILSWPLILHWLIKLAPYILRRRKRCNN